MKHIYQLLLTSLFLFFGVPSQSIASQEANTETVYYTSTFMNFVLGVAHDTYAAGLLNTVEANDWSWEAQGESHMPTFQMTTLNGQQCLQATVREQSLNLMAEFEVPGSIQILTINMGGNIGKLELDFGGSEPFSYNLDVSDRNITAFSFPFNGLDVESTLPNHSVKIRIYKKDAASTDPMYLQAIDIETEVPIDGKNDFVSRFFDISLESNTLFADSDERDWSYALPDDGTALEAYATNYNDEACVYMGLTGGSSTYHRLTLTPNFMVFGTVEKIIVKAAGDVALLSYTSPYGDTWNSEMTTENTPYFKDFELDFGDGEVFQNDLSFYLYAGRRSYLHSITLVMKGQEGGGSTTITTTFTMLMQDAPIDENTQHGIAGSDEGFIWDLFVQGQSTLMSATNLSFDGETMIPCLLVGDPTSQEETVFHLKNQFSLTGAVGKVVIRATGQIENIEAELYEKQTRDGLQQTHTASGNYDDGFTIYELRFDGTTEYQDGVLDIYFSGRGGIFINSITITQEGGGEPELSGTCGPDLKWNLTQLSYNVLVWDYETGQPLEKPAYRLTITGSGPMTDYDWNDVDYISTAPWMTAVDPNSITELELPDGITHVGDEAFDAMSNIRVANLPNSLISIGTYAFSSIWEWLTPDLYLPENLVTLGYCAFAYSYGIQNIYIPASLHNIEYAALSGILSLENFYVDKDNPVYREEGNAVIERATNKLIVGNKNTVIPFGVEAIEGCAFYYVDAPTIAIPGSVKSIGGDAFAYSAITSIDIPSSVTFIDAYAFFGCSNLLTVNIGSGVTQIGSNAFYNCTKILDVNCYADPDALTWRESSNEAKQFMPDKATKMHVRAADLEKWQSKFSFLNVTFVGDLSTSIIPITEEMHVRASFFAGVNLYDTSLGNVYYNLNPSTGNGYMDGYIYITEATDMSQINDAIPGSSDIRDNFTGIILEVGPGEGVIALDVATKGNISLVVQIGNETPTYAVRNERGEIFVSYNVSEPTYVYFYAVDSDACSAPAFRKGAEDLYNNVLLIYGFSVYPGADETGIENIEHSTLNIEHSEGAVYDLSGRKINGQSSMVNGQLSKGIYIVNGKKVSFK